MKLVAHRHIDFARVVPVKAAEGQAVIEDHAAIGDVKDSHRRGKSLAPIFPQRHIEGRVRRQIGIGIWGAGNVFQTVTEARAIVHIGGGEAAPREVHVAADVEGIPLVMVERRKIHKQRKVGQAAVDGAFAFRDLIRISGMRPDRNRGAGC